MVRGFREQITGGGGSHHRPPWIENDDRIRTKTLVSDHTKGIHVDIRK